MKSFRFDDNLPLIFVVCSGITTVVLTILSLYKLVSPAWFFGVPFIGAIASSVVWAWRRGR